MGVIDQKIMPVSFHLGNVSDNSPVLLVSETKLVNTANQFIKGFPGTVSYAVKANSDARIIEILFHAGIKVFDVASIEEMITVKRVAPTARIHYHNPVRSSDEILTSLHEFKCKRFSVDHISELQKIRSLASNPRDIEIAVRFAVRGCDHSVQDFSSKFGAEARECVELLQQSSKYGFKTGLTFHPGSQTLTPQPYSDCITFAAELAKSANCQPDFLNVGGGFPSNYIGSEQCELKNFFDVIKNSAKAEFPQKTPALECEPGRGIVAPSATLVTTVKSVRRERAELFLNDGIYGGLMEASQFPKLFPRYSYNSILQNNPKSRRIAWKAFGPTCDPVDVLPCTLHLPEDVCEGDTVSFHGLGAYCNATATRFNGYGNINLVVSRP